MTEPILAHASHPAVAMHVHAVSQERAALAEALGVSDTAVIDQLYGNGLRAATAVVLEWTPAVDVCWLDGADGGERNALRVRLAADERATVHGVALLDAWLTRRPSREFFVAAGAALRWRLRELDPDEREDMLDRLVVICKAAGRSVGADPGVGGLSARKRVYIDLIRRDLERRL